ncbi:hypothetical protein Tco_0767759 [Tanacetum coccineum]
MEECYCSLSDELDWNNPEGNRCPYDLSKLLPLHESQGRLTFPANFFFNNDLEYLRGGSTERKYATSTTKKNATKYDVEGIKDMVPKLWSLIKVAYDKILSVTSVTVVEWYGYGPLKEIIVRKVEQKLHKFMEGDFPRLNLNDIEDMLLLVSQNKLNNLNGNVIVHLAVGLCMYTRRIIIQSRVEDLQLGDGTPTSVHNTLDQMLKNLRLGYNKDMKRRKWTVTDQKWTRIMIKDINQYQNWRDLPRDIPLVRIEVLRYDTKGVKVIKGIIQNKIELTLEQTQEGFSDEVLVSIEGVEE